jgi:hypothetical protein
MSITEAKQELAQVLERISVIEGRYTHTLLGQRIQSFDLMTEQDKATLRSLRLEVKFRQEFIDGK